MRLHSNHVEFGSGLGAKKIILPDIEKADREFFAVGPPKIMDQTLGPCTPPGQFIQGCYRRPCGHLYKCPLLEYFVLRVQIIQLPRPSVTVGTKENQQVSF